MAREFTEVLQETIQLFRLPSDSTPYFPLVFGGEPRALSAEAVPQAVWKTVGTEDPPEGARNIKGRRAVALVFEVACWWPPVAEHQLVDLQESHVAQVLIGLPAAIVGLTPASEATTYTVAGKTVNLVTVDGETAVDFRPFLDTGLDRRVVTFAVHARILEAS